MLNKTSLGYIVVFITIIGISLSIFRVIEYFETGGIKQVPATSFKAEPQS